MKITSFLRVPKFGCHKKTIKDGSFADFYVSILFLSSWKEHISSYLQIVKVQVYLKSIGKLKKIEKI